MTKCKSREYCPAQLAIPILLANIRQLNALWGLVRCDMGMLQVVDHFLCPKTRKLKFLVDGTVV